MPLLWGFLRGCGGLRSQRDTAGSGWLHRVPRELSARLGDLYHVTCVRWWAPILAQRDKPKQPALSGCHRSPHRSLLPPFLRAQ